MSLHLILPGLPWPHSTALSPAADLSLPGLAYLLGRASRQISPFTPLEHQLAALFSLEGTSAPFALLRRMGETTLPPADQSAHWLCADPVHLRFAQDQMLIDDVADTDFDLITAHTLAASLNETIAHLGEFEIATPERWYLRLHAPCNATLFPLNDVLGRAFAHFLPEGQDRARWQHLLNEIQVTLYNHPLNQQREQDGARSINCLWLWGNGPLQRTPIAPNARIQSDHPLMIGLGRAAGTLPAPPDREQAILSDTLVLLDTLRQPAQHLDLTAWRNGLLELEKDWFAPLATAHRQGQLSALRITAPGDRHTVELMLGRISRWQFWRAPCSLASFLNGLPSSTIPSAHTDSFKPDTAR